MSAACLSSEVTQYDSKTAKVGILFEGDANHCSCGLWGGVEFPSLYGIHGGVDEERMSTHRFNGSHLSGSGDFDFQLNGALEVHAAGSFWKAGTFIAMDVTRIQVQFVASVDLRRDRKT